MKVQLEEKIKALEILKATINTKIVFISHPLTEDIELNRKKATVLLNKLHKRFPDIIFISPIHMLGYMDCETPEQREEIMKFCFMLIDIADEVWIYGLSDGCRKELRYGFDNDKVVLISPFIERIAMTRHICDECNESFILNEPLEKYEGFSMDRRDKILICPGCLLDTKPA